jgi:hypothetical protein
VSGPNYDELMEGASAEEEARLRRVHDLLVAAGPPPELPPALVEPPALRPERPPVLTTLPRRRFGAVLVAAAGIAAATFIAGWVIGDHRATSGASKPAVQIQMRPTAQAPTAAAVLAVDKGHDDSNVPMTLTVSNLKSLPKGGFYELWLTRVVKHGGTTTQKLVVSCGTFVGASSTKAPVQVQMNAPYTLDTARGWVITRHVPGAKTNPVVLTT